MNLTICFCIVAAVVSGAIGVLIYCFAFRNQCCDSQSCCPGEPVRLTIKPLCEGDDCCPCQLAADELRQYLNSLSPIEARERRAEIVGQLAEVYGPAINPREQQIAEWRKLTGGAQLRADDLYGSILDWAIEKTEAAERWEAGSV